MGLIQFKVGTPELIVPEQIAKADFVTFDGRVIASSNRLTDGVLTCHRTQADSSKLRIFCNLDGQQYVLQTASIRESSEVYDLEAELARGLLTRLRNFHALWTGAGLRSSEELEATMKHAHRVFRQSIFEADQSQAALDAIRLSLHATEALVAVYTDQRITYRRKRTRRIPMSTGCRLVRPPEVEDTFLAAFNAALVRTRWNVLEPRDGDYQWDELDALVDWATEKNLSLMGGPLLDLSSECFPEWMNPWKGDLLNLQSFTSDFVETVVSRYVGRIRHWEVVSGANCGGVNGLLEEQRLNLIMRAIEAAQQVDEQIQISLRVIQPWGEYLGATNNRLPPIQFVDTLRRSGARISEVNLDLRFGGGDIQSLQRDMLSVSQLLDHWSLLQMPMNVMVALPESACFKDRTADYVNWQAEIMERLMKMCLAKERVTGFFCLNWSDPSVQDLPLLGQQQTIHPGVGRIINLDQHR